LFDGSQLVHRLDSFYERDDLIIALEDMKGTASTIVTNIQNMNHPKEDDLTCQLDGYFEQVLPDVA
jgi:hypothetical protein